MKTMLFSTFHWFESMCMLSPSLFLVHSEVQLKIALCEVVLLCTIIVIISIDPKFYLEATVTVTITTKPI